MAARTIWLIVGILAALPLSAALVVVLVAFADLLPLAGLALLAVLDVAIVAGGYFVVRRSLMAAERQ